MSLTFKEFSQVYEAQMASDLPLTEQQLQEIFGAFFGTKASAADKAAKAAMDFKARKAAADKKKNDFNTQKLAQADKDSIEDENTFGAKKPVMKPALNRVSALDTKPLNQLRAGQLRALDRNPFGESVKK
jgi:hypothetical protein